jgi:hypothetical protein
VRHLLALVAVLPLAACGADGGTTRAGGTAGAAAPADAVRVVCDTGGARVVTPVAAAQPDGIHFEVENGTGRPVYVQVATETGGAQGSHAAPGASRFVLPLEPGPLSVTCSPEIAADPPPDPLAVEVVDEDGVWVSTRLDCVDQTSATLDYFAEAPGEPGTPVEVVRGKAGEFEVALEDGDTVEPAGYPDQDTGPVVRVVRGGEVVAVFDLTPGSGGGWLIHTVTRCGRP